MPDVEKIPGETGGRESQMKKGQVDKEKYKKTKKEDKRTRKVGEENKQKENEKGREGVKRMRKRGK